MASDNRSFVAKYSRILRKKLATKLVVAFLARQTLARFSATRRLFHLYLERADPSEIAHKRIDNGQPVRVEIPIDAAMEAHLHTYDRGLDGCLEPGRLILSADVRVHELTDCELLPWLGLTVHRPSGRVLAGGIDPQPRLVFRTRKVAGRVLSLLESPRGHNHFFHFFEHLTLAMHALSLAGDEEVVSLLVRKNLSQFQRTTLEALLRQRRNLRLVEVEHYEIVQPERLILATRAPCPIICWFALIDEWREIGTMVGAGHQAAKPNPPRKLHLSRQRQKIRRLGNEAALEPIFARHGFETVTPETRPFTEQIALISQAEAIISVEGAALTNLIFAQKPLTLYLMCPREILNPFWEGLTTQLGYGFRYVPSGPAMWYDQFDVDPSELDAALS